MECISCESGDLIRVGSQVDDDRVEIFLKCKTCGREQVRIYKYDGVEETD